MDEEASFSALLSSTAAPAKPSWDNPTVPSAADDPWANPFSDSTPSFSTPFSSTILPPPPPQQDTRPFGVPDSPREEISPYVQKINEDSIGKLPDPPSVIAAREQQQQQNDIQGVYASSSFNTPTLPEPHVNPFDPSSNPFGHSDPANQPFSPQQPLHDDYLPSTVQPPQPQPKIKGLPSSLIDEDLMAESDPEQSLKKAFVKSTPAPRIGSPASASKVEKKTYVFTPNASKKPAKEEKKEENIAKHQQVKENGSKDAEKLEEKKVEVDSKDDEGILQVKTDESKPSVQEAEDPSHETATPTRTSPSSPNKNSTPTTPTIKSPTSIPLPQSTSATPTISRVSTPLPPANNNITDTSSVLATPSTDRVSVSPLDAPTSVESAEEDYGFKSLSIGGSAPAPPVPEKEWGVASASEVVSPPSSRFGGKGWGVLDDEQEDGLFGKGGPSLVSATTRSDMWGNNDESTGGWGETSMEDALASAGPSNGFASPSRLNTSLSNSTNGGQEPVSPGEDGSISTPTTSPRRKISTLPVFQITVSDPTKVGDPVRGYTVYTVRTSTTSPHYRKGNSSVLRRFSDFLWLSEILTSNNPCIIVPPMPGKHTFGRFQDQFIETRRSALQQFLLKITSHPVLQLDPDLRLFLESDSFSVDSKNRKQEILANEKYQQLQNASTGSTGGILGGLTGMGLGMKFNEFDDWFESRNNFLNTMENQLKQLSKSIEQSSKQKLELSQSILEFSESLTALSESDLGISLSTSLANLAGIAEREKNLYENQAKLEVIKLLNLAEEYIRFVQSVRVAFGGRIKAWNVWQFSERELTRLKSTREKLRNQGKLGDRVNQSLAEIAEAERTVREQHSNFEHLTRLVKSEFVRFEKERIEEFKNTLESYLSDLIDDQKDLIEQWEGFHESLLSIVEKSNQKNAGGVNGHGV
ncbi:hypothetical protein L486_05960 [Kwoniella mangroviensis CBS 10435]|uniref:PX domain-containing protein n=1 Tax=Kwoniella mangroviensis CBS 10435 TaxID=1331196 RepID=A0A1B9INS1_9TREE|nr:hypothetical protein L486_05960 [Kwoniella mangroviensis CBS 10435]